MFATAVSALIPSLRLLAAPVLCHAPYGHGVVRVTDYSYGATSGYSLNLRCANAYHQEQGTNGLVVILVLWAYGWVGSLVIWGAIRGVRSLLGKGKRAPQSAGTGLIRAGSTVSPPAVAAGSQSPRLAQDFVERARREAGGERVLQPITLSTGGSSGTPDPVDQLTRLADLHDRGALTDAEFAAEKAKILGTELTAKDR